MKNYYSTVNNIICSFSDVEENNGFDEITVHFERNADSEISYAEGKLPDCVIYESAGFSEDELLHLKRYLKNNAALIWKMALESKMHTVIALYRDTTEAERVELIDGQYYHMPMVNTLHQQLMSEISSQICSYIHNRGLPDQIYYGRFGVFFDDYNMVEPDISVIQDKAKLSDRGCEGAPDWIIEIVMPGDPLHDYVTKLEKYFAEGVQEYWIVDGEKQKVTVYCFEQDIYAESHTFNEPVKSYLYKDLAVDFSIMDLRL